MLCLQPCVCALFFGVFVVFGVCVCLVAVSRCCVWVWVCRLCCVRVCCCCVCLMCFLSVCGCCFVVCVRFDVMLAVLYLCLLVSLIDVCVCLFV